MSVQQEKSNKKEKTLCGDCSLFYGSESFSGLCSSCYKKKSMTKKEEIEVKSPAQTSTPISVSEKSLCQQMEQLSLNPPKKQQKDKKRCFDCNKKIGLLGVECKCGYVYCNSHRLPQEHNCQIDYKMVGKQKLKKENTKIYNGKIAHI